MRATDAICLSFYADDFTGSTDALECISRAGIRAALFLTIPAPARLADFPGLGAIGVAGGTRAMAAAELETAARRDLTALSRLGAPIVHYKVCSTFDSSADVGSIGRVLDVGIEVFGAGPVPLLVGAPALGRYCVFGNLFARSGPDTEPFRLDRHPTMGRHPITPMAESDLRRVLAEQTERRVGLVDVLAVGAGPDAALAAWRRQAAAGAEVILLDILTDAQLAACGEVIATAASAAAPAFVAGSSGVEMALVARWRETGRIGEPAAFAPPGRAAPLLVLSGSCSPVTLRQTEWALGAGFVEVPLDTPAVVDPARRAREIAAACDVIASNVAQGRSVILHAAAGPADPRIEETVGRYRDLTGDDRPGHRSRCGALLGRALGEVARACLERLPLERLVVSGGDTSSEAARALGIDALEMLAPLAPGSPLCRARAPGSPADGKELLFKGGQVGRNDIYGQVLEGEA